MYRIKNVFIKLPKFRIDKKKMISLVVIMVLIVPGLCERGHQNRSNGIDRRKETLSGSAALTAIGDNDEEHRPQRQNGDDDDEKLTVSLRPPCGSCKMREELKTRNLEAIKDEVLRRMGFQSAPNVTGRAKPHVPRHFIRKMENDYATGGMQSDQPHGGYKTGPSISEEEDNFHIKTESVLTFAQPYPRLRHSWRGHDILHFAFSDGVTKFHVSNATLNVYVRGVERGPLPTLHLEVFQVYKNDNHGGTTDAPGLMKVATKKITQPAGKGDWISIDVTSMISGWFKNPRENLGFVVGGNVKGKKVVFTDPLGEGTEGELGLVPYVEISTEEAKRRIRRNLGLNCDEKTNESLCCRYPLTVDFEEFGWDFIIAPKRYEAHYCSGECPYITLQKHAHTHLLQMASPNIAGPCCTPRKMSSISMLYFDQQMNVVFGSLPGMVVERCGCS